MVRGALVRPATGLVHVLLVLERVRGTQVAAWRRLSRVPQPRMPRERRMSAAWAVVTCIASAAAYGMGGGGVWHGRRLVTIDLVT